MPPVATGLPGTFHRRLLCLAAVCSASNVCCTDSGKSWLKWYTGVCSDGLVRQFWFVAQMNPDALVETKMITHVFVIVKMTD